jgi:predicted RNA-binding Zn-ribbon protein involved in translation (DUF1610 family)
MSGAPSHRDADPARNEGVVVRIRRKRRAFRCERCGEAWLAVYEVREYVGPSDVRWIVHCRDGRPVPAPYFGDRCPRCGSVAVRGRPVAELTELGPQVAVG